MCWAGCPPSSLRLPASFSGAGPPVAPWHTVGSYPFSRGFRWHGCPWTDSAALLPCSIPADCQPEAPLSCACPCSVLSLATCVSFLSIELLKVSLSWPLPSSLCCLGFFSACFLPVISVGHGVQETAACSQSDVLNCGAPGSISGLVSPRCLGTSPLYKRRAL